jgi:hypothetical protein
MKPILDSLATACYTLLNLYASVDHCGRRQRKDSQISLLDLLPLVRGTGSTPCSPGSA